MKVKIITNADYIVEREINKFLSENNVQVVGILMTPAFTNSTTAHITVLIQYIDLKSPSTTKVNIGQIGIANFN